MEAVMQITQNILKEYFDYDDGYLVWKKNTTFRNHIGKRAGVIGKNGYVYVGILGNKTLAHRLIWMYHNGEWPHEIDHIDRNRANNRIENLRIVDRQQNNFNCGISKNNKSGVTGVSWHSRSKKWRAHIMLDYKQISLGLYDSVQEAAKARSEAELKYHNFANGAANG